MTDPVSLQAYYADVEVTGSFVHNYREFRNDTLARSFAALGRPTDRTKWGMYATTVNAYYSPALNEIAFPAAILQLPIFHGDLPSAVNYGAFGSIAGHEVSHAFDNSGRRYDGAGRYRDWWTGDTAAEFERRAGCFIAQYDNMTVTVPGNASFAGVRVRGNNTLGENIADAAGLAAAFDAWQTYRATLARPEPGLPELDGVFTDEQLFFVATGNLYCAKMTPAMLQEQVRVDVHSPERARVLGLMQNSRGFKEAFKCPQKEPVCELW